MKICIVSDSHDHRELLAAAVAEAKSLGAQAVIHCGDLVAPSTLHAIIPLGLPIHLVHGNNTGDLYHLARLAQRPEHRLHYYGQDGTVTLAGKRIFLVHYPHYAKAMALTGDYDLVCNGHEHRAVIEWIRTIRGGQTLRVDPGSVGGVSAPATYVLGDLASMQFSIRSVPRDRLPPLAPRSAPAAAAEPAQRAPRAGAQAPDAACADGASPAPLTAVSGCSPSLSKSARSASGS